MPTQHSNIERDALPTLAEHDSLDAIGVRLARTLGHEYVASIARGFAPSAHGTTDAIAAMRLAYRLRQLADDIDQAIGRAKPRPLNLDRCPTCNTPTHASESADDGRCQTCYAKAPDLAGEIAVAAAQMAQLADRLVATCDTGPRAMVRTQAHRDRDDRHTRIARRMKEYAHAIAADAERIDA